MGGKRKPVCNVDSDMVEKFSFLQMEHIDTHNFTMGKVDVVDQLRGMCGLDTWVRTTNTQTTHPKANKSHVVDKKNNCLTMIFKHQLRWHGPWGKMMRMMCLICIPLQHLLAPCHQSFGFFIVSSDKQKECRFFGLTWFTQDAVGQSASPFARKTRWNWCLFSAVSSCLKDCVTKGLQKWGGIVCCLPCAINLCLIKLPQKVSHNVWCNRVAERSDKICQMTTDCQDWQRLQHSVCFHVLCGKHQFCRRWHDENSDFLVVSLRKIGNPHSCSTKSRTFQLKSLQTVKLHLHFRFVCSKTVQDDF